MTLKAAALPGKYYDEATHQWIETPPEPAEAAPAVPASAPAKPKE